MIKAFGRRAHMAGQFRRTRGAAARHRGGQGAAGRRAPGRSSTWCPTLTLGRRRWSPARSRSADGGMTLGELVAFVSLQLMLIWPIDALGYIIANAQEAMTAADRIYEVLDTAAGDRGPAGRGRRRPRASVRGAAALRGRAVQRTRARPTPVLRGVDLEVRPGETLAIVGATGSRQDHPRLAGAPPDRRRPAGRITLDGRDIRDITLGVAARAWSAWRSRRRRCSR